MPASSIVCHWPLKVTCGSAHSLSISSTCSSERLPRLWKFSFKPTYSTGFQPMPMPKRKRPPDSTSREAACLATSAVCRCGRIITWVENSIFARAGAQEPEHHEGIVEEILGGVARTPVGPARDVDAEHVIGRGEMVDNPAPRPPARNRAPSPDRRRCRSTAALCRASCQPPRERALPHRIDYRPAYVQRQRHARSSAERGHKTGRGCTRHGRPHHDLWELHVKLIL